MQQAPHHGSAHDGVRTAVILAGGKSSRFGSNKCFARYRGRTLLEWLIMQLSDCSYDVALSGPKGLLHPYGLTVIEDAHPFEGPLAALSTIFSHIDRPRLLLLACDMPFLSKRTLDLLWNATPRAPLTAIMTSHGPSPLPGCYAKRLHQKVEQLLQEGRRDLRSLLTNESVLLADLTLEELRNINTQSDFGNCLL